MNTTNKEFFTRFRLRRLVKKARKMSNEDLRSALWATRKRSEEYSRAYSEENKMLLKIEGIYSDELKKRELLEWALRTGSEDFSE